MGHKQSTDSEPLKGPKDEKDMPSFHKMTCCEKWVSGLSLIFWGLYCLLGLAIAGDALKKADKEGNFFYHDPMSTMSEAWTFIFLTIMGIYNAIREALIAVEHRMTLIITEVINLLLYLTASVTLFTGPWTLEGNALNMPMLISGTQMLMILSVVLGLFHVIIGIMRPSWRAEAAKTEAAMSNS